MRQAEALVSSRRSLVASCQSKVPCLCLSEFLGGGLREFLGEFLGEFPGGFLGLVVGRARRWPCRWSLFRLVSGLV